MIALNGRPCSSMTLDVPWRGRWVATVILPGETPSGGVLLTWGSATLAGSVDPGSVGTWQGEARATVVGGLGWGAVLPATWLQNDAGLQAPAVAGQLAQLTGERLAAPANAFRRLRTTYARPRRAASASLQDLLARGAVWWVDLDGTTRAGARPSQVAPSRVEILELDAREGLAELDAEDVGQVLVGSVLAAAPPRRPRAFRIVELRASAGSEGQKFTAYLEAA